MADLQEAFDWYESQYAGLGWQFKDDFKTHVCNLARDAQLYAVRFADVRRLNLDRFPYGLFYVIRGQEIWLLAVSMPAVTPRKSLPNGGGIFVGERFVES